MKSFLLPVGHYAGASLPSLLSAFSCGAALPVTGLDIFHITDRPADPILVPMIRDLNQAHTLFDRADNTSFFPSSFAYASFRPELPSISTLSSDPSSAALLTALRGKGDQAQVHHRAILAWQQLQHSVQLEWRELARCVPSHRPPYDDKHHISGYNLFVSAYHGFAQLGREHIPEPQPYPEFPISSLQLLATTCSNGVATIRCRLILVTITPDRWHLSARIQLAAPGVGCDPSKMRSCMATRMHDNEVEFSVPNSGNNNCQAHIRYRLIDEVTGYRNNWIKLPAKQF